MNSWKRIYKYS